MFATLREVKIIFENVEVITVPAKYILVMYMEGIKEFRRSFQNDGEGLVMFRGIYAEKIFIKIDVSAKSKIFSDSDNELFQRITCYPDITSIGLKYSDGVEESICSDWKDATKGEEENFLQDTYFEGKGNLVIKIGKFDEDG